MAFPFLLKINLTKYNPHVDSVLFISGRVDVYEQLMGEFLGTMMLIILGDGVVANVLLKESKGYHAGWVAITTGWFIAVVMGVFVAQSAGSPNADINPAVTFAKYWLNIYTLDLTLWFMLSQLAGAFFGAIIVWLAYLPH